MNNHKSAKDIAFDKERQKFYRNIKQLEQIISDKNKQIADLQAQLHTKDSEIALKDDWIERLLSYTELSKEQMQVLVAQAHQKEKLRIQLDGWLKFLQHIT